MVLSKNSDFLFGFEAVMTNPNGDPDQEDKPRMDYETKTVLVSDARRKRDIRNTLKEKGYPIFVDTLTDQKVEMKDMFKHIRDNYLQGEDRITSLFEKYNELKKAWEDLANESNKETIKEIYEEAENNNKKKTIFNRFNNEFTTAVIKERLIDLRIFGSAMAVDNVTRTFTGPVQITWGYSLHPVELMKSNTITSIMSDDSSTFGKKHKIYYGLVVHSGTINKFSAEKTGMTEKDKELFRKALVQGILMNQTDSKQGQTPLFYLELQYNENFDGFIGDLRRFLNVKSNKEYVRSLNDLEIDDSQLSEVIEKMKNLGYIDKIICWYHPLVLNKKLFNLGNDTIEVDLWKPMESEE
ncbi:CRISPR-associated protein [Natranaerofaba carboxydovora]|uniref:CRISPR-associated protein n=1 Tax=Natranaerofaba carboxydovora TaxID=2742683 RepID=UPI001F12A01D|nr:type I CRISPR-associated protein Cas7 [Natranaerofaba carboxydovora]UMZ72706.1 CRISPR-associated protein Cas7 [Natranaerofaba carboxydovora]